MPVVVAIRSIMLPVLTTMWRTRSRVWWPHLASAIDHTNLDWICGPDDAHIGMSPHAISVAEKQEYARQQMRAYVWSGGGTRPPWSY
jgi:hypothetical protein